MACECELQNTLDVDVTQDALLDVEIGGSAGVLLQAKSVDVTENGTSVVAPDDGFDGLKSVEINTNVPKRFECGDAVFYTIGYNGGELYKIITKVDVSCLVTKQTKSINMLFFECEKLTDIIGLDTWDTSMVSSFRGAFSYCRSLEQLDLSNWKTSNVTDIYTIFSFCYKLRQLDISTWDVSKATDARSLFHKCQSLKALDLSSWEVPKVEQFGGIFNSCTSLLTIIGDKTIQDVENGTVALRGVKVSIETRSSPLRFSSILALANGLADLTGGTARTLTISKESYNNMYNDDDTIPSADVIAERQARIAAICAAKNWNFAH